MVSSGKFARDAIVFVVMFCDFLASMILSSHIDVDFLSVKNAVTATKFQPVPLNLNIDFRVFMR